MRTISGAFCFLVMVLLLSGPVLAADPVMFGPADSYTVTSFPLSMHNGDFNRDGKPDLVFVKNQTLVVLMNNGAGAFTKHTMSLGTNLSNVAVASLPGDSIPDLFITDFTANLVHALTGNGDGAFTETATYPAGAGPNKIVSADFNNDGLADLAICRYYDQNLGVLLGNGAGGFQPVTSYAVGGDCYALAPGLVNGDSRPDLTVVNKASKRLVVLLSDGSGGFLAPILEPVIPLATLGDIALGDMDGDGKLDAVVIARIGHPYGILILKGDGTGGYASYKHLTSLSPSQVRLADLNGNGRLDIVAAEGALEGGLSVFLSLGHGHFSPRYDFNPALGASLAVADFNPTTLPDVAIAYGDNTIRVMKGLMVDSDGDVLADLEEPVYGTSISNPDTDGDGMIDGFEALFGCLNPVANDADLDPDDDDRSNLSEYLQGWDPCERDGPDADGDLMEDWWENRYACVNALFADGEGDYDNDFLTNYQEFVAGTNPCINNSLDLDNDGLQNDDETDNYFTDPEDPDTDHDGLRDGIEVLQLHTSPLLWDSDGDYLPDGFEAANMANHPAGQNLDPLNILDGPAGFDDDSMPNQHEYWNGSRLWNADPVPESGFDVGCYYWGKSNSAPYIGPEDIVTMQRAYAGFNLDYSSTLPSLQDPLDLDRDGSVGPGDISLCQYMFVEALRPEGYPSSPASLSLDFSPGSAIAVGDTTHVTVSVHAQGPGSELYSSGFGVVFWVTSGNAALLGGEGTDPGEAAGNRYDISMDAAPGALANIVVLVTGPGPVVVNAKVPACGVEPIGRWCGEVALPSAAVINP